MAGSYYNGHLVDEDEADALVMAEPYGVEGVLAAEISAVDLVSAPPVVTIVSPALGATISAREEIVFEVVDADGLSLERVLVQTGSESAPWEQAYRDGAACAGYAVSRSAITGGYRYVVTRDAGWRAGLVRLEPVFGDPRAVESINT